MWKIPHKKRHENWNLSGMQKSAQIDIALRFERFILK